ncbi:MAG: hypothetical protein ABIO94_11555, partial [Opitutaceae bacterium]
MNDASPPGQPAFTAPGAARVAPAFPDFARATRAHARLPSRVIEIIESADPTTRDLPIDRWCAGRSVAELLAACDELDGYRRQESNLYQRVRAVFFIATIHRYHLPACADMPRLGRVPHDGFRHLLERRFEEAITTFASVQRALGPSETLSSAIAAA